MKCGRVNYCQYDHIFSKDTCVRTTVLQCIPRGRSGIGKCRKATGNCPIKTGVFNEKTRRWNHRKTIGGKAAKSVKGPSKDEVQNRVPLKLLLEILEALKPGLKAGPPAALMPLLGPGGMVGRLGRYLAS